MRRALSIAVLAGLLAPGCAWAGPPFLTDDPEPTETGHWEIYAPLIEAAGRGPDFDGSVAIELNYGAAPNLQLTLGLPITYAHGRGRFRTGRGDLELSAKYRFFHDETTGVSAAVFPGVTLPTAVKGLGAGRVTALLPVWLQKDAGPWSIFGGGGYAINPGTGARNYSTAGVALTRQIGHRLLLGVETDRQGADAAGGRASTSFGVGAIYQLQGPFRLLASGGPTLSDGGGAASFHLFVALGTDL